MNAGEIVLLIILGWIAVVVIARLIIRYGLSWGPGGSAIKTVLWTIIWVYSRLVHRVRLVRHVRWPDESALGRGLIIVANHTGACDALLVQACTLHEVRWMMGRDMMTPGLDMLWNYARVIPVDRSNADSGALRTAIRHVRGGGVLGIFPEGRIVKGGGEIRPFSPGVGLIVARSRAPVLLTWIHDTPTTDDMASNLTTPSRAVVEFVELLDFDGVRDPAEITRTIRERLSAVSGWPINDEPLPPIDENLGVFRPV